MLELQLLYEIPVLRKEVLAMGESVTQGDIRIDTHPGGGLFGGFFGPTEVAVITEVNTHEEIARGYGYSADPADASEAAIEDALGNL